MSNHLLSPSKLDSDVFAVRRCINQARCIMQDVLHEYFHDQTIQDNLVLMSYSFTHCALKAEIVDNLLTQLDDALKPIEAAIEQAEQDEEAASHD